MNDFVVAIRALGESCGLFYKELINQGFTKEQSMKLVEAYVIANIQPNRNKEGTP